MLKALRIGKELLVLLASILRLEGVPIESDRMLGVWSLTGWDLH